MDLFLLQDFQTLGGVLRLEYLISITDQINFNQVRNLFSSSTTRMLISGMVFPPSSLSYPHSITSSFLFPYFFHEISREFVADVEDGWNFRETYPV